MSDVFDLDAWSAQADHEVELAALRERMGLILDAIADGVITVDLHGKVEVANPAACALLGASEDELRGQLADQALGRRPDAQHPDLDTLAFAGERYEATERLTVRDGSELAVDLTVSPILHTGVAVGAVVVFRDVSARLAAQQRLEWLATHCQVTGLVNRRGFEAELAAALSGSREADSRVALLFCDLDDFKAVNDTYGHDAGDEVLRAVARRLIDGVRELDVPARFAGDEFCVLLRGQVDEQTAHMVAGRLEAAVLAPVPYEGHELRVGVSIGVTIARRGDDPHQVLAAADQAMYQRKQQRKRR